MSVNIKGIGILSPPRQTSRTGARETRAGPAATGSASEKPFDRILFSDIAVSLQKLDDYIRDIPVANNEKIVTIRERIADGRYEIDAMRLATNFLGLELPYHQVGFNDGFHALA